MQAAHQDLAWPDSHNCSFQYLHEYYVGWITARLRSVALQSTRTYRSHRKGKERLPPANKQQSANYSICDRHTVDTWPLFPNNYRMPHSYAYKPLADCTPTSAVICDVDATCESGVTGYTCGEKRISHISGFTHTSFDARW